MSNIVGQLIRRTYADGQRPFLGIITKVYIWPKPDSRGTIYVDVFWLDTFRKTYRTTVLRDEFFENKIKI